MQTTPQTPLHLTTGAILRSGRETITIVSAHVTPAGRPEQPRVVVEGRTSRGVRFMLGDQHGWHWRADRLAVALETHGYEVAA